MVAAPASALDFARDFDEWLYLNHFFCTQSVTFSSQFNESV